MQNPEKTPEFATENRNEKDPTLKTRARRMIARTAIGATFTTGVLTGALQYDIYQGKQSIEGSRPSIEHVHNPTSTEYHDSATVILPGFGTKSSIDAAERLKSHADTGHVFALEYSNKDINIGELTETIVDKLQDQEEINGKPLQYVSFDGYSMGGIVLLAVAAKIHQDYPELTVTSITLNSTPVGSSGLSQESSQSIEAMSSAIDFCDRIKLCSGIEYSRAVQHIIEISSRHGEYLDVGAGRFSPGDFQSSVSSVSQKLSADDAPSPVLAYNQAGVLEGAGSQILRQSQEQFHLEHGIEQSIEALSSPAHDKPTVPIFYTMSDDPRRDRVVDVEESARALQEIAERHDADLKIFPLPVDHVNIYRQKEQYDDFIAEHVNPVIEQTVRASSDGSVS